MKDILAGIKIGSVSGKKYSYLNGQEMIKLKLLSNSVLLSCF